MKQLPHQQLNWMRSRPLIGVERVAQLLSCSIKTFNKDREYLETVLGFPPPLLGGGQGSTRRWDENAIMLWRYNRMPENLRALLAQKPDAEDEDPASVETRLAKRAEALHL